tara:strand:- start:180 stop:374 length:195 start_codon:yes stop_codon:yes gene_type:complete
MEKNNSPIKDIKKIENCRNCQNSNLKHILSPENQYLVDFLEDDTNFVVLLDLVLCERDNDGIHI